MISYTGTWMQNVGAGWLMTQLTMSPLMVSLVQAATTLPVFLVILPAGALADMVDRRRFLLITQGWMVVAAALLGVLTLYGHITPWILLGFTFVLGLGAVMNDPAWQAITPEIVSTRCHAPAVALNSVGFNVARAVGPALGGLVIAAAGSGVAFLLNAASFFGVIFFLYRWKRPHFEQNATGRVRDAMLAGLRYVRGDSLVRCDPDPYRRFQLGRQFPARPATVTGETVRRQRIRLATRFVWPGCPIRRSGIASLEVATFCGRRSRRCNLAVRRHDLRRRTRPNIFPALSGIVRQRNGVDWNSGLPEHCGADHVAFMDAGACALHVPAGSAGRDGVGQRGLGSTCQQSRSAYNSPGLCHCTSAWALYRAALPLDGTRVAIGAISSSGLTWVW